MNLTLTPTKQPDGQVKVSWLAQFDFDPHDIKIRVWFGKKKTPSTKVHVLYTWASWETNTIETDSSRTYDLSQLDANWQQANFDGYVCQSNYNGAPSDQYHCMDSATVKLTKK